jgi:hypothetical protein
MSIFEPWAGKRIGEFSAPKLPNLNRQQFTAEETTQTEKPAKVQKTKPPVRKPVTLSEEPQMDYTPTQTTAPTGKIPVKHTRAYPKMQKKQTAPGTKPRKR